MASYTFTSTDGRIAHAVLRGRQLASSDITETSAWQQAPVPALTGGVGVLQVDLAAGAPAIRISITAAALVAEPAQGYLLNPGQSQPFGIAQGDVVNVRTA